MTNYKITVVGKDPKTGEYSALGTNSEAIANATMKIFALAGLDCNQVRSKPMHWRGRSFHNRKIRN